MRLLQWTTEFFKKKGSESPRLDAEILLAHARDCRRIDLYTAFADVPDETQLVAYRELVRRRGGGVPVAQLVGTKEFYSLSFRVDENVLVPRPETEHLVTEAVDLAKSMSPQGRPVRIADIGTGTGAIACSLAHSLAAAEIVATDVSAAALKIAKWNVEKLGFADRIELLPGDLTAPLGEQRFDIVCSNPPYVSQSEYDQLPPTVRDHEPAGALLAGPTGREVIERLLGDVPDYLYPGGWLLIELSPMIAADCKTAAEAAGFQNVRLVKDIARLERILVGQSPASA